MNQDISVGEHLLRTLPKWINGGQRVMVTVTKILKDIEALNGHDLEGTWIDGQGVHHRGKFYLKDLTLVAKDGHFCYCCGRGNRTLTPCPQCGEMLCQDCAPDFGGHVCESE